MLTTAVVRAADLPAPAPQRVAEGVWLVPGFFAPGRQPDGNTIIFEAARGLVVMDTGRHPSHTQAILDLAARDRKPVTAILNSHWHLDHTGGNEALKARFPDAPVVATHAVERAIREFWPASTKELEAYLPKVDAQSGLAEDIRLDIHAQTHPAAMRPDVAVDESGERTVGGVQLHVGVARNAATDADLWVFDAASGVLASGDLVTLPVPFLDTACIAGWRRALLDIAKVPFHVLVPGHGRPMSPNEFTGYQVAFEQFASCARSRADKAQCAADWVKASAPWRSGDETSDVRTAKMAEYYVGMLRENGGDSARCAAR